MNVELIIFDLDDTLYDTSNRINESTPNFAEMQLLPNVKVSLETIKSKKIILTQGNDVIQNQKIDTLGIRDLFDEIIIVSKSEDKINVFEKIFAEYSDPKRVMIVGDRRDAEIRYGNQKGFVTALVPGFKYKNLIPKDQFEIPTFEVKDLSDILSLL